VTEQDDPFASKIIGKGDGALSGLRRKGGRGFADQWNARGAFQFGAGTGGINLHGGSAGMCLR
jgi:hypothetical protein